MPLRVFISSVQSEFAEERRNLRDFIRSDATLSRYFDVFLFEDQPAHGIAECFEDGHSALGVVGNGGVEGDRGFGGGVGCCGVVAVGRSRVGPAGSSSTDEGDSVG